MAAYSFKTEQRKMEKPRDAADICQLNPAPDRGSTEKIYEDGGNGTGVMYSEHVLPDRRRDYICVIRCTA